MHPGGCAEAIRHSCSLKATPGPFRSCFPFLSNEGGISPMRGDRRGSSFILDFLKGIGGFAGRHVIGGKTRVFGTPEISPRASVGPILGSECPQFFWEQIRSSSFDLMFHLQVNSIFTGLRLNCGPWTLWGGTVFQEAHYWLEVVPSGPIWFRFSLVTGVVAVTHQPRTCTARSENLICHERRQILFYF